MGFENRRSIRIKTSIRLCYWPDSQATGSPRWGQVVNLSETGMALSVSLPLPIGHSILMEFSLQGRKLPLLVPAKVIHCDEAEKPAEGDVLRVQFQALSSDDRLALRQYIIQVADPKLASQTGWGHAYFKGAPSPSGIEVKYRILSEAEQKQSLEDHAFLAQKEMVYLKKFQAYLEATLGSKAPADLRLMGSRALKENGYAWMELNLGHEHLHLLAKVLWSRASDGEKHEVGLQVAAFQRDEALKVEKG
jgi:hypothetical protein